MLGMILLLFTFIGFGLLFRWLITNDGSPSISSQKGLLRMKPEEAPPETAERERMRRPMR